MLDYRKESVAGINAIIGDKNTGFGKSEALREEVLNGLLAVAVWHSLKDGQVTPAIRLLAAVKTNKDRVCQYLTKFGNLAYSEKKGLHYRGKMEQGLDNANEVFATLPELEEAFPASPKQYRDLPFMASIRHILKRAEEVKQAGKTVVFANDEEKALFEQMAALAKLAA